MSRTKSGTCKVQRVFRHSGRRVTIAHNLTESEAQRMVRMFAPRESSMVVYFKQP